MGPGIRKPINSDQNAQNATLKTFHPRIVSTQVTGYQENINPYLTHTHVHVHVNNIYVIPRTITRNSILINSEQKRANTALKIVHLKTV